MSIAIVAIAYNRIDSLKRLLDSVSNAYYDGISPHLIISIDKSDTDEVERFADDFVWDKGPKRVIRHEHNLGLKNHIIGLGDLTNEFEAIILLEDDLIVSPNFYRYALQTVEKYNNDINIAGISLYNFSINYENYLPFEAYKDEYDVYFMKMACSWGEIWMKNQFADFKRWYNQNLDFDKDTKLPDTLFNWGAKSWLKYYTKYCAKNNKYFVFPHCSLATNYSEDGANHASNHLNNPTVYQVQLQHGDVNHWRLPTFTEKAVKYDVFFNNEALYKFLGFSEKECCIDIYGNKHYNGERYWLTNRKLNYLIINSYAYSLRPIEDNIFRGVNGADLFLYDTSVDFVNNTDSHKSYLPYFYRIRYMPHFVMSYGCWRLFMDFSNGLIHRIKNTIRRKRHH